MRTAVNHAEWGCSWHSSLESPSVSLRLLEPFIECSKNTPLNSLALLQLPSVPPVDPGCGVEVVDECISLLDICHFRRPSLQFPWRIKPQSKFGLTHRMSGRPRELTSRIFLSTRRPRNRLGSICQAQRRLPRASTWFPWPCTVPATLSPPRVLYLTCHLADSRYCGVKGPRHALQQPGGLIGSRRLAWRQMVRASGRGVSPEIVVRGGSVFESNPTYICARR